MSTSIALSVQIFCCIIAANAIIDCDEAFECESRIIENITTVTVSGYKSGWKSIIDYDHDDKIDIDGQINLLCSGVHVYLCCQ